MMFSPYLGSSLMFAASLQVAGRAWLAKRPWVSVPCRDLPIRRAGPFGRSGGAGIKTPGGEKWGLKIGSLQLVKPC